MFADYLKDLGQHQESQKFFKSMSHDVPLKPINKVKLNPSLTEIMKKSDARVNYECLSPVLELSTAKAEALTKDKISQFKRITMTANSTQAVSTLASTTSQITLVESVKQSKLLT